MNSLLHGVGVLLLSIATSVTAAPTLLTNFQQLVNALEQGMDVKAVIYLDHCRISTNSTVKLEGQNLAGASTRINFNTYLHDKVKRHGKLIDSVTTSETAFNEYLTGSFVQSYTRVRLFEDNSVHLYVATYDPVTYEKKLSVNWLCAISNGQDQNAVMLFNAGM